MTTVDNDPAVIRDLLVTRSTWAVVGLSENTERTAYRIAQFLNAELEMDIVAIHPSAPTMFGRPGYACLDAVPDDVPIDVVDCFVNSSLVGAVVDQAIANRERLGITAIWLQLGVIDEAAADRAREAGLKVVMDTCPKIEYPRIEPGDGNSAVVG